MTTFGEIISRTLTHPPSDDGNPNGYYAHAYLGRHATFTGRPYRRGKARCAYCGAPLACADGPKDHDRHLTIAERIRANLHRSNPLLRELQTR